MKSMAKRLLERLERINEENFDEPIYSMVPYTRKELEDLLDFYNYLGEKESKKHKRDLEFIKLAKKGVLDLNDPEVADEFKIKNFNRQEDFSHSKEKKYIRKLLDKMDRLGTDTIKGSDMIKKRKEFFQSDFLKNVLPDAEERDRRLGAKYGVKF